MHNFIKAFERNPNGSWTCIAPATFSGPATLQTASWTPTVVGTLTITWTNSGSLTNPANNTITVNSGPVTFTMNNSLAKFALLAALAVSISAHSLAQKATHTLPTGGAIDAEVKQVMARTHANGLAIALIDHGKVIYVQAYGIRNAKGEPLTTDTVMYGASLTKMVFSYHVLQLVDQGKLKLDKDGRPAFKAPARPLEPADKLAAAAKLGTLDRTGKLVTAEYGTRVHVADVIRTDLPLVPA